MAIGPSSVSAGQLFRIEAHVQAAGSVLRAHGTGFVTNLSASGMAVGASTGLRLAFPWAKGTPWLGIEGFYWQGDQRTVIESSFEQRDLPRIELLAGAGIGLGELRCRCKVWRGSIDKQVDIVSAPRHKKLRAASTANLGGIEELYRLHAGRVARWVGHLADRGSTSKIWFTTYS